MTRQDIASLLFENAVNFAAQAGRHFGEGADLELRAMTERASTDIANIGDPAGQSAQVTKTTEDLHRLITMAIEEAAAIKYSEGRLGEMTFFPALQRFCPCPPLC